MIEHRSRPITIKMRVNEGEAALIEERMAQLGTANREAFLRKMALDGYILRLDMPELKELVSQLRYMGNNLNQLTKRVNATGRAYAADLDDIRQRQEDIWQEVHSLLIRLGSLK